MEAQGSSRTIITGTRAANTQCKFSNRRLPSLLAQLSIATLETLSSRANSRLRSLRRRCTSPSVQDCLIPIGGVTSSGGWIICKSTGFETLHNPPRTPDVDLIHSYTGSIDYGAKAVLMWNFALDGNGQPLLPGTDSCQNPPCRGVVTINGGSYTLNEECKLTHVYRLRHGLIGDSTCSLYHGPSVSGHHSKRPRWAVGSKYRCECRRK